MKIKIIFTIAVLLCVTCISCTKNHSSHQFSYHASNHVCTKDTLAMSPDIVPYFDAFIDDCKKHNFKYDHAYCLDWIELGDLRNFQGETNLYNGTIEIKSRLAKDTIGMKFVVYHELGHWLGLEHSDGSIMKDYYNTQQDMEWAKNNWDELVEDYFNKLKN